MKLIKERLKKDRLKEIATLFCVLIFSLGLTYIVVNITLDYISKSRLSSLQGDVRAARSFSEASLKNVYGKENGRDGTNRVGESKLAATDSDGEVNITHDRDEVYITYNEEMVLTEYQKLHEKNPNFYGWLLVEGEGSGIDYPVMQGPDNQFYLSHNIDRKYDKYGMLLLDENCDLNFESPNMIIYGHNVHNGDLFGNLINYKDKGYYSYHPQIRFDNLYECNEFNVFAVLRVSLSKTQEQLDLFTTFNYDNKEEFDKAIKWIKDNSLYEIDYTPSYGDALLTLVTCEYTNDDGRFVVIAGQINEENSKNEQ